MKKYITLSLCVLIVGFSAVAHAAQTKSAKNTLDAYAPFEELLQITASDVTTYDPPLRGCIIETAGDVVLTGVKNSTAVTITAVAGQLIPAMVTKVGASTTATLVCGR